LSHRCGRVAPVVAHTCREEAQVQVEIVDLDLHL